MKADLLWELAYAIVEAKRSHGIPSVSRRTTGVRGVTQSKSKGLRIKRINCLILNWRLEPYLVPGMAKQDTRTSRGFQDQRNFRSESGSGCCSRYRKDSKLAIFSAFLFYSAHQLFIQWLPTLNEDTSSLLYPLIQLLIFPGNALRDIHRNNALPDTQIALNFLTHLSWHLNLKSKRPLVE